MVTSMLLYFDVIPMMPIAEAGAGAGAGLVTSPIALEVSSEEILHEVHSKLASNLSVSIEFESELVGAGPRKHRCVASLGALELILFGPATNRVVEGFNPQPHYSDSLNP
jgi:hypothetical protein